MIGVLLTPLELIYAAGLRAKNARYDRTEPARLKWPVVSVGNLSVGGAGKTPLVIRLAHLLARARLRSGCSLARLWTRQHGSRARQPGWRRGKLWR